MTTKDLTIIVPTLRYSLELDEAIESAIAHLNKNIQIVISINSEKESFVNSKFWKNSLVSWIRVDKYKDSIEKSLNFAVNQVKTPWVFILSDDDKLTRNFPSNLDFNKLMADEIIYLERNLLIENNILNVLPKYKKSTFKTKDFINYFFNHSISHSISSFIFSRKLFSKVGGFIHAGYPNGYYVDTIFHGKLIANASNIHCTNSISYLWRVSINQGSSKFYFQPTMVNSYFKTIARLCYKDKKLKKYIDEHFINIENFRIFFQQQRFFTDLSKLSSKAYNVSLSKKIIFIISFLRWDVSLMFKVKGLFLFIFFPLKKIFNPLLTKKFKQYILERV